MTNRDRILSVIRSSLQSMDDDLLSRRSGVRPRQTVNMICRQLAEEGVLQRTVGPDGKIVHRGESLQEVGKVLDRVLR